MLSFRDMEEYTNSSSLKDSPANLEQKRIVLNPIHDSIAPEESNDAQIAASHIVGAPIGNIASDTESTAKAGEPLSREAQAAQRAEQILTIHKAAQPTAKKSPIPITVIAAVIAVAILIFALVYR